MTSAAKPTAARCQESLRSSSGILVTGATGFLGKHLIEALRDPEAVGADDEAKRPLRALVRTPTLHLERHAVEAVGGDVCLEDDCRRALQGVSEVYHLAGRVMRAVGDESGELYRLHVEGTRRILLAAAEARVRRVVVVSTSGTIAVKTRPESSDEAASYPIETLRRWPYYLSKIYQEQTATRLAEELGIDVVRVNPSLLLGPGDERGSSTQDVDKVVRGRLPIIPRGGGVAFVDARDAARGCILAMKRGRAGERYLLSAENVTLANFLGRIARIAGVSSPRAVVSARSLKVAGRFLQSVLSPWELTSPLDPGSVEMAEYYWYCDTSKARRELGFETRDSQVTLFDTVRDIQRRRNMLSGIARTPE